MMRLIWRVGIAVCLLALAGCIRQESSGSLPTTSESLSDARLKHTTRLKEEVRIGEAVEAPPDNLFLLVAYPSSVGRLPAYLSRPPNRSAKHPAIIWLVGGFSNSIGSVAWEKAPLDNDQSASAFRRNGIVTMYPSLRGGNQNPGSVESFYGEIDDVMAAAAYLKTVEFIDPDRIYLGGHSTGGTLALLAAENSGTLFRAVFALGPVDDPSGYGSERLNYDVRDKTERQLRAPGLWLEDIRTPVFVFEGSDGNIDSLRAMQSKNSNPKIAFYPLSGYDHFNIIGPLNNLIAEKIVNDSGSKLSFTKDEILGALKKAR
jgi:pimeloyl-ACP methyl ester carboxylesterase